MLSKNKIKFIKSLENKKFRDESACFLAEGNKLVNDILAFFDCELLLAKATWLATQGDVKAKELLIVEDEDIAKASLLKTPQDVIAVFRKRENVFSKDDLRNELTLILDGIQDPGNLGTIIRLADWFGIKHIVCSEDTVDVYNTKTVQATMGALARVKVFYASLPEMIDSMKEIPVYGTFLDGDNLYKCELSHNGLIIMGNEGKGIRQELVNRVNSRLYIPNYPPDSESTESLNVAVATAVVCAEFRRRQIYSV